MSQTHQLALPEGYVLEGYSFGPMLGKKGGFGITYLAMDIQLQKKVAIKELMPDGIAVRLNGRVVPQSQETEDTWNWALDAFKREARILATFKHSNIVQVHRLLEANGTAYIVMEYLEGQSLESYLKERGPEPPEEFLRHILNQVMDGLDAVHQKHMVHRDIKPDNIYLTTDRRVILLDFGAARPDNAAKTTSVTQLVAPGYSPFEQYQSNTKLGPYSDIYSASATMARAITGQRPPNATDRIMDDEWVPLRTRYQHKYSASLLSTIDAGLQLQYRNRPSSIAAWRAILASDVIDAPPPPPPQPPPPPDFVSVPPPNIPSPQPLRPERPRTNKALVAAILLLSVVSAGLIGVVVFYDKIFSKGETQNSGGTASSGSSSGGSSGRGNSLTSTTPPVNSTPKVTATPSISTFEADDDYVESGEVVTLSWDINPRAEKITISPSVGDVSGSTSYRLTAPPQTTTYTLTARNGDKWDTQALTINVGSAPRIVSFQADASVVKGERGKISWNVENADEVKVNNRTEKSQFNGWMTPERNSTFVLSATNKFGEATKSEIVTVTEDPWAEFKKQYEDNVGKLLSKDLQDDKGENTANYVSTVTVRGESLPAWQHCAAEKRDNAKFRTSEFLSYWVELQKGSYSASNDSVKAKQWFFFRRTNNFGAEYHDWCSRIVHVKGVTAGTPLISEIEREVRNTEGKEIRLVGSDVPSGNAKESVLNALQNKTYGLNGITNDCFFFTPSGGLSKTYTSGGRLFYYTTQDLPSGLTKGVSPPYLIVVRPYAQ